MNKISISIPAHFVFVPGVRLCIARICLSFGFNEHEEYQVQTVIDELCNNAIEHGSKTPDKPVHIYTEIKEGELVVTVQDTGNKHFNVESTLAFLKEHHQRGWETEEIISRGRGLFIVQKLTDTLDIQTGEKGTTVKVTKKHNRSEKEQTL